MQQNCWDRVRKLTITIRSSSEAKGKTAPVPMHGDGIAVTAAA
jgi:hypothetical protein